MRCVIRFVAIVAVVLWSLATLELTFAQGSANWRSWENICSGGAPTTDVDDTREFIQLKSLCTVWYPGASLPPMPTPSQVSGACVKARQGTDARRLVASDLNNRSHVCYFATLDSDNDGVPDFRISAGPAKDSSATPDPEALVVNYVYGIFSENDPDVDDDGVPNLLDRNPVNPEGAIRTASCARNLPAHIDWSRTTLPGGKPKTHNVKDCRGKDRKLCQLQKRLYYEYDIATVERTSTFTLASLQAADDAITKVFKTRFESVTQSCKVFGMLKVLAAENCDGPYEDASLWLKDYYPNADPASVGCPVHRDPSKAATGGTLAVAAPSSRSVTIYDAGQAEDRVNLFGTLVHELGHNWQFAMDMPNVASTDILNDNLWEVPNFMAYVKDKGWSMKHMSRRQVGKMRDRYVNMVPGDDLVPYKKFKFGSMSERVMGNVKTFLENTDPKVWSLWRMNEGLTTRLARKVSKLAQSHNVVGAYSLGDPWEWHGDNLIAYAYQRVANHMVERDRVNPTPPALGVPAILKRFKRIQEKQWGNGLRFDNISKSLYASFSSEVPISSTDLDHIVCRYVVDSNASLWDRKLLFDVSDSANVGNAKRRACQKVDDMRRVLQSAWRPTCGPIPRKAQPSCRELHASSN